MNQSPLLKRLSVLFAVAWTAASLQTLNAIDIEARYTVLAAEMPYTAEGMIVTQVGGEFLAIGGVRDSGWLSTGSVFHEEEDSWETFDLPFAVR
ncbi:MAG TPA: hypothetical protein VJ960_03015, partial [Oceanipulchritudo sp.]|nr:hypothetical protein [Oceanipulchritudo sp.]